MTSSSSTSVALEAEDRRLPPFFVIFSPPKDVFSTSSSMVILLELAVVRLESRDLKKLVLLFKSPVFSFLTGSQIPESSSSSTSIKSSDEVEDAEEHGPEIETEDEVIGDVVKLVSLLLITSSTTLAFELP